MVVAVATMFGSMAANAQVPPRFYWKPLQGMNAVPVIAMSVDGNINPLDPSLKFDPSASLSADIAIAGYAKMFPVWNKAAMLAVLMPMGSIAGESISTGGSSSREASSGFGDPMIEFNMNLIGPPPIMNLPDLLRYEPGFSLDLVVDVVFPLGQYDNTQSLNLGQNRWYGRIGTPIIWQLGPWIPASRTTLEIFPSVWFLGDNDDFVGENLHSDPTFETGGASDPKLHVKTLGVPGRDVYQRRRCDNFQHDGIHYDIRIGKDAGWFHAGLPVE